MRQLESFPGGGVSLSPHAPSQVWCGAECSTEYVGVCQRDTGGFTRNAQLAEVSKIWDHCHSLNYAGGQEAGTDPSVVNLFLAANSSWCGGNYTASRGNYHIMKYRTIPILI